MPHRNPAETALGALAAAVSGCATNAQHRAATDATTPATTSPAAPLPTGTQPAALMPSAWQLADGSNITWSSKTGAALTTPAHLAAPPCRAA